MSKDEAFGVGDRNVDLFLNLILVQINLYGGSTSRLTGGHLFFVARYILHPSYNRNTLDFDIALLQVDVRLNLSLI